MDNLLLAAFDLAAFDLAASGIGGLPFSVVVAGVGCSQGPQDVVAGSQDVVPLGTDLCYAGPVRGVFSILPDGEREGG